MSGPPVQGAGPLDGSREGRDKSLQGKPKRDNCSTPTSPEGGQAASIHLPAAYPTGARLRGPSLDELRRRDRLRRVARRRLLHRPGDRRAVALLAAVDRLDARDHERRRRWTAMILSQRLAEGHDPDAIRACAGKLQGEANRAVRP